MIYLYFSRTPMKNSDPTVRLFSKAQDMRRFYRTMDMSIHRKASIHSDDQEISEPSCKCEIHYHADESPFLSHISGHINPIHTLVPCNIFLTVAKWNVGATKIVEYSIIEKEEECCPYTYLCQCLSHAHLIFQILILKFVGLGEHISSILVSCIGHLNSLNFITLIILVKCEHYEDPH
jgi:hypothetical protein